MKKIFVLLYFTLSCAAIFSQSFYIQEDFNSSALPNGWTNSAISGTSTWSFGIDGSSAAAGNNNLDGTAMAFFDDDQLGVDSINNTVSLTSPTFDNSNDSATFLEFDYNFREFPGLLDSFYVEVYDGANWNVVFSRTANDCGNWLGACVGNFPKANIDITRFKNSNCQIRFTYHDGNDWSWYVGLDNVIVRPELNNDLSVVKILSPVKSCNLSATERIQVVVKNNSSNNISGPYILVVNIDDIQGFAELITIPVNAKDSITYTFNTTADFSSKGMYKVQVYSIFTLDSNAVNDTVSALIEHTSPFSIPFNDGFEATTSNWITYGANNSWQIGIPSGISINTAQEGTNVAATNLTGNYNNSETSYLESPCIFSNQLNKVPYLSFYSNYISEWGLDFLIMESSIDNGATWQKIEPGTVSSNWHPTNSSWTGISTDWRKIETSLNHLLGESSFKIRFKFSTDQSSTREGFAIDQFSINYQPKKDLSLEEITYPAQNTSPCRLSNEFVGVLLKNKGQESADSVFLNFQVNNGVVYTELLDSTINPGETVQYIFSTPYDFSALGTYSINAWLVPAADSITNNDSILNIQVINSSANSSPFTIPFYENFDGPNWVSHRFEQDTNTNAINYKVYLGTIDSNWSRKPVNLSDLDYNWGVDSLTTPSGSVPTGDTGPSDDYNIGGNYLYVEASSASLGRFPPNTQAFLTSPCIQIPVNKEVKLSFYTHGYGIDIGDFDVEIFHRGNWEKVASFNSHPQTSSNSPWTRRTVDLSPFSGSIIKVKFNATAASTGFRGDLAIDNVEIYEVPEFDLQVRLSSVGSFYTYSRGRDTVSLEISNTGTNTILPNQFLLNYQLNNTNVVSELFNDTLKVDSTVTFKFANPMSSVILNSVNSITAYSQSALDSTNTNDTARATFWKSRITLPYSENFDTLSNVTCIDSSNLNNFNLPIYSRALDFAWTVQNDTLCNFNSTQGATQTEYTGPLSAASGNNFLYMEAERVIDFNPNNATRSSLLEIGCFDFTGEKNIELEYKFHMYSKGFRPPLVNGPIIEMGDLYWLVIDSVGNVHVIDTIIGDVQLFNTDPWITRKVNLSSFAGQIVRIAVRGYTVTRENGGLKLGDMALDDIKVYRKPVSIQENKLETASIQLYPNPNNGNFNLNVSNELVGKQYQVFDIKGGLVKQARIDTPNAQIELSHAEKGVYFIKIEGYAKAERIVVL